MVNLAKVLGATGLLTGSLANVIIEAHSCLNRLISELEASDVVRRYQNQGMLYCAWNFILTHAREVSLHEKYPMAWRGSKYRAPRTPYLNMLPRSIYGERVISFHIPLIHESR